MLPSKKIVVDGTENGWRLNPLEAEAGDPADIIVDIEKAIRKTFIPSSGPLEMNETNEWAYEMLWNKFGGAGGFSLSPLCEYCLRLFACLNRSITTYNFDGCEWASSPNSQGKSFLRHLETEICCNICRLIWDQLSVGDRERLDAGFVCKIFGSPESGLYHLNYSYLIRGGDSISATVTMFSKREWAILAVFSSTEESMFCLPNHCDSVDHLLDQPLSPIVEIIDNTTDPYLIDVEVFPNSFISRSINSATSWALARLWLQHCANNHKECRSLHSEERRLPTRLIDLGRGNKYVQPQLCHSDRLPQDTTYMTLSHRWGASEMLQLTLNKLEVWSNALPVAELPLTFKDAMEATKQLGVQYLWIDCLCIIQDSDDDWQREAAAMGDVYQNSHCNLTAASPNASSTTGLFASRDPSSIQICFVETRDLPYPPISNHERHWFCWDGGIWKRNVVDSPLFKRGWVVQEHILAPRVLHFTERQIFWECLERRACETLPALIPALNFDRKLSVNTLCITPGPLVKPQAGVIDQSLKTLILWEAIVERYSATSLTFTTLDKLTALSGIAKKVGMTGEYLAGLWKIGLEVHLMWHRKKDTILNRPKEYQAPSWSWASVNGSIEMGGHWPTGDSVIVVTVLDVNVERVGLDPTGRVRDGQIRLCSALAPITVRNALATAPGGWWIEEWYETVECKSIRALPDMLLEVEVGNFYALIIALNSSGNGVWGCDARGLLLEPTGGRNGEYYRRGLFCCQAGKVEFEEFLKLFRDSSVSLNSRDYKDEHVSKDSERIHGLPIYEITII